MDRNNAQIIQNPKAGERIRLAVLQQLGTFNLQRDIIIHTSGSQQTLKGILNIGSGQRTSVGENHSFPQREGIGTAILRDLIPGAEASNNMRSSILPDLDLKEPVKNIHGNHVVIGGLRHIHGGEIRQRRHTQDPAFHPLRRRITAAGCQRGEYRRGKHQRNDFLHINSSRRSKGIHIIFTPRSG